MLELHCGAGNFTGPLAARARQVAAVEVQGPALELARADEAERGGPGQVRFFAGDALKLALAFARERGPAARRFGAVLLDPPREGAKGIGPALRALEAPRAVYVSCDPATLARDVRGCVEVGYRVAAVVPVDMFPRDPPRGSGRPPGEALSHGGRGVVRDPTFLAHAVTSP